MGTYDITRPLDINRLRRVAALCAGAVALGALGCRPSVEPTAYVGDGTYEGEPPMCLQYDEESRPGAYKRSLIVHFNNTCDFAVDCMVYNDVVDNEQRVVVLGNGRAALLVATGQDAKSFGVELHCQWQG